MTEQKNKEVVFDLVKNHFSLDKESLERFAFNLFEPNIDERYASLLEDSKNLRKKIKVSKDFFHELDLGWKSFKEDFVEFFEENNVTYENFREGLIKQDNQRKKIFRSLCCFYEEPNSMEKFAKRLCLLDRGESYIYSFIEDLFYKSTSKKIPSKKNELIIVLSLNFVDWFLSATGESWSSCLSLESESSGAYWTGLPGLIVDKNRALLYLTDETAKVYAGMAVERCLSRSWLMLDENNEVNIVKFYPNDYLKHEAISNILGVNLLEMDENFRSKHRIEPLFFDNGKSCFIFQDKTRIRREKFVGYVGGGGYEFFEKYNCEPVRENIFSFSGGLKYLVQKNQDICNAYSYICEVCGKRHGLTSRDFIVEERKICRRCYDSLTFECELCSTSFFNEKQKQTTFISMYSNNYIERYRAKVCIQCHEQETICCDYCEGDFEKNGVIKVGEKNCCLHCLQTIMSEPIEDDFLTCNICGEKNNEENTFSFANFDFESKEKIIICDKCSKEKKTCVYKGTYNMGTNLFTWNTTTTSHNNFYDTNNTYV